MGTIRRLERRRRRESLPQLEALERRRTPTTLPAGFTEATVATSLGSPTAMEFAPDGRLFVLEQTGNVELVRADGTTWTALHLNVDSQGERGVLGIAFDPAFASNHFVYLYYTNPGPGAAPWATSEHNQLSRFTVDDSDPTRPVFTDEAPILDWDNLSAATNHNGGAIHFGLDGMLYADSGDNLQTFTQGAQSDRVSQTLSDLLGKQLRIDVNAFNQGDATRDDTTVGHLIPADNPFVGIAPGIDQLIFALGLRNPFTFAVQPGTGTIFIDDVGEATWEEIDRSVPGANFGWSGGNTDGFGQTPPGPGVYQDPLLAYNHSGGPAGGGIAIVGGTFYDPSTPQFPASYIGKFFYADLGAGWIRVFNPATPGSASDPDTSAPFASGITGTMRDMKVDQAGHLYYLTGAGIVERISFEAPGIAIQPTGETVNEGQSTKMTVAASGASLAYQWQHFIGATWTDVGTSSPAYSIAATTIGDAGAYRVVVSNPAGFVISNTVDLAVIPLVPPTEAPGLNAGFFAFTRRLKKMPSLTGRAAAMTRIDAVIDDLPTKLPWAGLDDRFANNFAVRETGFLEVSAAGRYKISLRSKDGARLWLDGKLLVNNGGIHPVRQRNKAVTLTAGVHALQIDSFAGTGVAALVLSWSGPGIARQVVPADHLLHAT